MDSISFRKDFSQGYNVRVIVSSPSALYSSFGSRFHYVPTFENRKGPKEDLVYICLNYDNAELAITFDYHANKVHVRAPTYQRMYDEIFTAHSQRVEFITNAKMNWEGKVVHDRVSNVSYVVIKIEDNAYDFVYMNNKKKTYHWLLLGCLI